jgi:hypothetical protein
MNPRVVKGAQLVSVVAIVVAVAVMLTPAGAHVTGSFRHLWRQHIKPKLSTPGAINNSANPVDWTQLKGVPSDFADGVDDLGVSGGGGLHDVVIVNQPTGLSSDSPKADTALCPAGNTILGGGVEITGPGTKSVAPDRSRPNPSGEGWIGGAYEHTSTADDWELTVYAICATP